MPVPNKMAIDQGRFLVENHTVGNGHFHQDSPFWSMWSYLLTTYARNAGKSTEIPRQRQDHPQIWSEIQLERSNRPQIAGTGVEAALRADPQPVPSAEEETEPGHAFISLPKDKFEPRQAPETSRFLPKTGFTAVCRQAMPRHRGNARPHLAGNGRSRRDQRREHQAGQHQVEQGRAEAEEKESTYTVLHPGSMASTSLPRRKRYP